MKTSSRKSKGRKLQQIVAKELAELYNVEAGNFVSRPMGSNGKDLIVSPQIKTISKLGKEFSIECKNKESCNLRKEYEDHAAKYPGDNELNILVHKKNNAQPLVVLSLKDFKFLLKKIYDSTG